MKENNAIYNNQSEEEKCISFYIYIYILIIYYIYFIIIYLFVCLIFIITSDVNERLNRKSEAVNRNSKAEHNFAKKSTQSEAGNVVVALWRVLQAMRPQRLE
jgi:ABC-type protease/lipase transport system fused ATPase/permease subunit